MIVSEKTKSKCYLNVYRSLLNEKKFRAKFKIENLFKFAHLRIPRNAQFSVSLMQVICYKFEPFFQANCDFHLEKRENKIKF